MSGEYDLNVQVQLETEFVVPEKRLCEAVSWVLHEHHTAAGTGISIVIADDNTIRQMNCQYRDVDKPTDVLSFPADPAPVPESEPYLGDLVLALPYIQRQAAAEGHSIPDELVLAVIHGTLHLLGYDHDTPERQAAMWAKQAQALKTMGVSIEVPLFDFSDDEGDDALL